MINHFFSTHQLTKNFGGLQALNSLEMTIHQGEIHGIIGPNGAGKTTLINVITGLEKPSTGRVNFLGKEIDQWSPERIMKEGISRTFQDAKIVPGLTVLENVMIGLLDRERDKMRGQQFFRQLFDSVTRECERKERGREILERFKIQSLAQRWADDLVWFERQLVQIARAIASEPCFLLLDEPTAGMDLTEKRLIEKKLKEINQSGVTILLTSHDMQFIHCVAQRITVLDFGQKIGEGLFEHVLENARVREAYFGKGYSKNAIRDEGLDEPTAE